MRPRTPDLLCGTKSCLFSQIQKYWTIFNTQLFIFMDQNVVEHQSKSFNRQLLAVISSFIKQVKRFKVFLNAEYYAMTKSDI